MKSNSIPARATVVVTPNPRVTVNFKVAEVLGRVGRGVIASEVHRFREKYVKELLQAPANEDDLFAHSSEHFKMRRLYINGAGTVLDISGSRLRRRAFSNLVQDKAKVQRDFDEVSRDMKSVLARQSQSLTTHS